MKFFVLFLSVVQVVNLHCERSCYFRVGNLPVTVTPDSDPESDLLGIRF